ncbi:MAG: VanZ family protein [Geminicoccaceae bacterium]
MIAIVLLMPLPFGFVSRSDLLGHFLLFGVMAITTVTFARNPTQIVILAVLATTYGVGLEWGQGHVPGRMFDIADAAANMIGGIAGCLGALAILRVWSRPAEAV